ncbi:MAG: SLC13 family permease [Candidatus Eremiobacteraeota bacterium]|nr:SLC13 family permease [Candidatus Eremiobacteraeota bacterium]
MTFLILAVTVVLFLTDWLRLDIVALLCLLALLLTGVLTTEEALAGFSDPLVVILAGLFVIGGALSHTGVADRLGNLLAGLGGRGPRALVVAVMGLAALLSAFMSSTGTVAVLIPSVTRSASVARVPVAKLLMPLAFGCLIGGLLTLIGTAPNLVVDQALREAGLSGLGFFGLTPIGLLVLAVTIAYMAWPGQALLVERAADPLDESGQGLSLEELVAEYRLADELFHLVIRPGSPLIGHSLREMRVRGQWQVNVVAIEGEAMGEPDPDQLLGLATILHVQGQPAQVRRFARWARLGVARAPEQREVLAELGLAEVLLPPRSRLLGKNLREIGFFDQFGVTVVAIARLGKMLPAPQLSEVKLRFGDTLLVEGPWGKLAQLERQREAFVVLGLPRELTRAAGDPRKAGLMVGLVVAMLVVLTAGWLPMVTTVLAVAVLAILTGCIDPETSYRSISWESLVLVAAMLPTATALEKTGGVKMLAEGLVDGVGPYGPYALLAALFLVTALLSQFISNTATTVVIAPIAVAACAGLGLAPTPFLVTVAVAASAAFATPIASPVNTLVLTPGGYRFADFVKVGLPLQALVMLVCLAVIPRLFPF